MKKVSSFRPNKLSAIVSAALLLSPLAAIAQSADAETASDKKSEGLEIIEVTAQRRVQNMQEVPVSLTAINPNDLERRNVSDVYQMTLNAPSLQFGQDNTMSIRGAGTLAFSNALDSSVAVAVDDINLGRRFLFGPVFNDIYQIEVLNGPQGLLYGKNASAGLVNIRTIRPQLGIDEGKIDVEYQLRNTTPDNSASVITRGTYNMALTDTSALRVNAHYASEDPITKRVTPVADSARFDEKRDDYGVKLKYLNEISEDLSLYIIGDINKETGAAGNFDQTYRSVAVDGGKTNAVPADGVTPGKDNLEYGSDLNAEQYRDVELKGLQATVNYAINDQLELTNIIGWRTFELAQNYDADFTSLNDLSRNETHMNYDQFSNELRLSITEEAYQGQIGLYYFNSEYNDDVVLAGHGGLPAFVIPNFPFCVGAEVAPGGPPNCSISNDDFVGSDRQANMKTESMAVFGQFDFNLTDALTLTTGLRYTKDDIEIDIANFQRLSFFTSIGAPALRSEQGSSNNVSGKVALQYSFSPNNMAYASYSKGYKGPGFSDTPSPIQNDIYIRPETVNSYEIGVKSMWLDNRLIVNATAFSSEFKDYQVQAFDAALGQSITQNAAQLTSEGLELTITAMPIEDLTISFNASYLDATFDDYPGASCYPGQADCGDNGTFNASGLDSPTAAKITNTTSVTYNFDVSNDAYGYATLSYYHRDPMNLIIGSPEETQISNIDQFGVNVGLIFDSGWSVTLFCKNCTDNKVPSFISLEGSDSAVYGVRSGVQTWGFNSVRNIGVRVEYEF
ncbi:TonB-dependent receptor [Aliiglaciecola sp. NS0011-25]|uniref:TonB-dependent receptor n=1 Tax=Aliiglaciecola sp. NS0011-25 TaxID=3127654 RepID=UPI003340BF26